MTEATYDTAHAGYRRLALLCFAIALAVGITAAIGIFARGDGSTATGMSIRGEAIEYATTGVYAFNDQRIVAEGVGWDVVTLVLAVPVLLAMLPALARGSFRARLLALGVLSYFFYQYLMYAVAWALGPLFPAFIVLFVASATAIVWLVSTIRIVELPQRFSAGFPRREMIAFCVFAALLLIGMWSVRITRGLAGDLEGAALLGMTTLAVQALDLGVIVPLSVATAVLLWQRRAWGYLLAPVIAVKGVTMAAAICAMLISAAIVEGSLEVVPFVIFTVMATAAVFITRKALKSVIPAADTPAGASGTGRQIRSCGSGRPGAPTLR